MASRREQEIDHILRRAGFGATQEEVDGYARLAFGGRRSRSSRLLSYEQIPDDVDEQHRQARIRRDHRARRVPSRRRTSPMRASAGCSAWCTPSARSRRRWRSSGTTTSRPATRRSPVSSAPPKRRGCSPRSRRRTPAASRVSSSCSASTRWVTSGICSSPSRRTRRCSCGSTGASNVRAQPQENFARELMELFTMGVGTFAETDVYAGARVFTGWNLARPGSGAAQHYTFNYNPASTRHREGVHVPDLPGRRQDDPGARGRVGHDFVLSQCRAAESSVSHRLRSPARGHGAFSRGFCARRAYKTSRVAAAATRPNTSRPSRKPLKACLHANYGWR